ncbi:MAG: M6 family metalloprotease domain-containing protein [Candidatus Desantisbacteria bacterium]
MSWLLLLAQPVLATPPLYPGMGSGHRDAVAPMHHRMAEGKGKLFAPGEKGIGNAVYTTGTVKVIALLVGFSDVGITKNRAYFEGLMNNFARYYQETSYGKLTVQWTLSGTYTLGNSMTYYGESDLFTNGTAEKLIEDAVKAANGNVDFSQYDALMVIHAGQGQESSDNNADIYSQFVCSSMGIVSADGVGIFSACIVPEHEGAGASPFGIFCHEFGHQLGLPDLYDTDGGSEGIGNWSEMASGAWNGSPQGSSPAHFDAWCKVKLDWVQPQIVNTTLIHQPIPQAETNPVIYKLWNNTMDNREYFLVENRQGASLPGKGLLVYHVDEWQQNNDNQSHYKVALEQADGRKDLENNSNRGDAGDPYPGNTWHREFNDLSTPNSRTYSGVRTCIAVENISDSAGTMTADINVVSSTIILNSPTNGSITTTTTPTFQWSSVEGIGTYALIIGTRTITVVGTTCYTTTSLVEDASYQWHVTATTTTGGIVSSTEWQFWVNAIQSPPSVPTLLSPINNQIISQQTPTFGWQISIDPDQGDEVRYILWYSKQQDFATPTKSGTLTSNSYTPAQSMDEGIYFWKVTAMDTTGNATWSTTATVTINMITKISAITNWPNPFIGRQESTNIYYVLKDATAVSINIYNPIGELVWSRKISAGDTGAMDGVNIVPWDGKNGESERVNQGIYFCVIEADGSREIRKIGVK